MRIGWIVLALAGCGRFEFDPATDARAIGHDEDGDGIPDDLDPCPALAGDATDRDHDGVGDACDPDPFTIGDAIAVFSPLTPASSLDGTPDFTQEDDDLHAAGPQTANLLVPIAFRAGRIEMGFDILTVIGSGQHQAASGIEGSTPYYFVELNEDPSMAVRDVAIVSFESSSGYTALATKDYGGFHTGRGILRYDVKTKANPRFDLVTGWDGELYAASAAVAMYTGGSQVRFTFNGVDVKLRYVLVISSPG